jgi:kynurenine formamidase
MADQQALASALGQARFYDLSQPITAGCPGWPDYPSTVLETVCTTAREGFNAERLDIITHTGTHLDVPYHFYDEGKRLHEVPADEFQGPAAVLDLRPLEPGQGVGPAEQAGGKTSEPPTSRSSARLGRSAAREDIHFPCPTTGGSASGWSTAASGGGDRRAERRRLAQAPPPARDLLGAGR